MHTVCVEFIIIIVGMHAAPTSAAVGGGKPCYGVLSCTWWGWGMDGVISIAMCRCTTSRHLGPRAVLPQVRHSKLHTIHTLLYCTCCIYAA